MSISAQPYQPNGLASLKPSFDALGLYSPAIVIAGSETTSGLNETETFELTLGEKSLKARILTLIENNKPNIALDLMQKTMHDDRDLFDELYFDVKDALQDRGYEQDAKELDTMSAQSEIDMKPKADIQAIQSHLFLG